MTPLLLLALSGDARAAIPDAIPAGTALLITGIGKEDAFYRDRKALVGLACRVADPGLDRNDKRHYGGPVSCNDGEDYYFYQIRFDLLDEATAAAARVPDTARVSVDTEAAMALVAAMAGEGAGTVADGAAGGTPGEALRRGAGPPPPQDSTATNAETSAPAWPVGARARIASVSAEDAYGKQAADLKGKSCAVADAPLSESGNGWWAGQLQCDDGEGYYFYQVSLTQLEAPVTGVRAFGPGKLVKVLAVDTLDALYAQRSAIEGHTCSVSEVPLVVSGTDLYAGRLFCDDGKQWQLFRVTLTAP